MKHAGCPNGRLATSPAKQSTKERQNKGYRKNWARLIQKIYEVDPLACPRCQGQMRIIAFIEKQDVIKEILKHLGLWAIRPRPPPLMTKAQMLSTEPHIDYSDSQVPPSENAVYVDSEYPADLLP